MFPSLANASTVLLTKVSSSTMPVRNVNSVRLEEEEGESRRLERSRPEGLGRLPSSSPGRPERSIPMNTMAVAVDTGSVLSSHYRQSEFPMKGGTPRVVIVTTDTKVHGALAGILHGHGVSVEWVKGVEAAKSLLDGDSLAACLCGFGLEDGSYKDLVKLAKHQIPETPVIIVSTPSSSNEYGEYLAAMNAGAFDFLCHPYQKREVERILRLAINSSRRILR
jgi:CheY-like chemotaxis protein